MVTTRDSEWHRSMTFGQKCVLPQPWNKPAIVSLNKDGKDRGIGEDLELCQQDMSNNQHFQVEQEESLITSGIFVKSLIVFF